MKKTILFLMFAGLFAITSCTNNAADEQIPTVAQASLFPICMTPACKECRDVQTIVTADGKKYVINLFVMESVAQCLSPKIVACDIFYTNGDKEKFVQSMLEGDFTDCGEYQGDFALLFEYNDTSSPDTALTMAKRAIVKKLKAEKIKFTII